MNQFLDNTLCKNCLGCEKCENPFFEGIKECNWFCPSNASTKDVIAQTKENLRRFAKQKYVPGQVKFDGH